MSYGFWSLACMYAKLLQLYLTLCDPVELAHQAPLSVAFSRQEDWNVLLCPPLGDLPDPGIKPAFLTSPALAARFFTTSATWEALWSLKYLLLFLIAMEIITDSRDEQTLLLPGCSLALADIWSTPQH